MTQKDVLGGIKPFQFLSVFRITLTDRFWRLVHRGKQFNTAKKCCPATCITAIVTPNRLLFGILVDTYLTNLEV